MKFTTLQAALGSASLFLSAQPVSATTHGHRHAHEQLARRHAHGHHQRDTANASTLQKRAGCTLPSHPDLVPVPGEKNGGFAMAPDVSCLDGKYCPFACPPGKVMAQWQPGSKYVYPESMNGGLLCNNGVAEKPFPDKPYCVEGSGAVQVVNKVGKIVSFCQTVLPGDEAMVIRTDISNVRTIAVPDETYWAGTAAHYYINPPGVSAEEGCVWGTESKPIGNWSPYVAGANTVEDGNTFVKIAWNPMFIGCALKNTPPTFGIRIECPQGGCNGLPCEINPTRDGTNGVNSPVKATGVGSAEFCVATVPRGKTANIVVFNVDGSEGEPEPAPPSSVAPPPPSSTKAAPSSTPTLSSSSKASSSSSSSSSASDSSDSSSSSKPSSKGQGYFPGGIFHENATSTEDHSSHGSTKAPTANTSSTGTAPVSSTSKSDGAVDQSGSAIAGLIVALVAAAALY